MVLQSQEDPPAAFSAAMKKKGTIQRKCFVEEAVLFTFDLCDYAGTYRLSG